jgi:hypothetical protein
MPIRAWLHYADHPVAPICRSSPGSNMAVGDKVIVTKYDSVGGLGAFCGACGSPFWLEPAGPPQYRGIPLGVMDDGCVPAPDIDPCMGEVQSVLA